MNPNPRYSTPAIAIHWLAAVMILCAFVLGINMVDLPMSPTRLKLINWHKWLGASILALSLLRLLWRATHRPPADLPMPRWQQRAAHLTHGAMYLLFLAVPLVGWTYSSAAGFPVVVFGVLPLPDLVGPDEALSHLLKPLHGQLAMVLLALIAMHLGAALKHQLIDRDGILWRMIPRVSERGTAPAAPYKQL